MRSLRRTSLKACTHPGCKRPVVEAPSAVFCQQHRCASGAVHEGKALACHLVKGHLGNHSDVRRRLKWCVFVFKDATAVVEIEE